MTDQHLTDDGEPVVTLQDLIRARIDERGWTYADLARRSGDQLSRGRWQQISTGNRLRAFPEPASLEAIAAALEVDVTTVLLATARSVGLDARMSGPELAHLLPAGTDLISDQMRDAILTLIRAAVADALRHDREEGESREREIGELPRLSRPWSLPKPGAADRRNAAR